VLTLVPAAAQAEEGPPPLGYANNVKLTTAHTPILANGKIDLESTILGEVHCLNTFAAYGWNEHEHGEAAKPERGIGEVVGWGTSLCEAPKEVESLEAVYHKHITVTASAEMPLEKELQEAEVCTEETKTLLSECKLASERRVANVPSIVRRRVASLPWLVELIRGQRGEAKSTLEKVGVHAYGEAGTATAQNTACFPKEKFINPETLKEEERAAVFTKVPEGCVKVDIIFPQIPLEFIYYGTQELWGVNGFTNGLHPSKLEFKEPGKLFSSEGGEGEGNTTGEVRVFGNASVQLMTAK
jgi:hypothetical protein